MHLVASNASSEAIFPPLTVQHAAVTYDTKGSLVPAASKAGSDVQPYWIDLVYLGCLRWWWGEKKKADQLSDTAIRPDKVSQPTGSRHEKLAFSWFNPHREAKCVCMRLSGFACNMKYIGASVLYTGGQWSLNPRPLLGIGPWVSEKVINLTQNRTVCNNGFQ